MIVYQKIFQKFHLGIWLLIVLFATFDRKEANAASIKVNAIEKSKRNQRQDAKCQEEADESFNKFSNDFPQKWKEIKSKTNALMECYVSA